MSIQNESFFTIDVEEYFHIKGISSTPPLQYWDSLPGYVEKDLSMLLDLLDLHQVKATLFFLGYVAKKYPHLVTEATKHGHDIASHGMYHQLVFEMTPEAFFKDVSDSKNLIEDISGIQVNGYRSPCFSATDKNPWLFEKLVEAGFKYDSSVFPAQRTDGGLKTDNNAPYWIDTPNGKLLEFPISIVQVLGKNVCFFGGGYLRLFPKVLIIHMAKNLYNRNLPVMYYIHPREIDAYHPRMKVSFRQHFKSYINLKSVPAKLNCIMKLGSFTTCGNYYDKIIKNKDRI